MNDDHRQYDNGELAEALDSYIDPSSPDFDAAFAIEIMEIRPDWFTKEEIAAVTNATRHLWN